MRPQYNASQGYEDNIDNRQLVKMGDTDDAFLVDKSRLSKSYLDKLLNSSDSKDKIMLNLLIIKIVKHDHKDSLHYLLDHGYKIDILNDQNQTIIHLAIYYNSYNILNWGKDLLLSKCSSDNNYIDINGLSHLHFACLVGKKKFVKKFLENKADINARWYYDPQDDRDGFTPLHFAVMNLKPEIVKFLLHCRADINSTDSLGRTCLHLACCVSKKFSKPQDDELHNHPDWNSEMKIMKLLVMQGADLNFKDKLGNTPFLSIFKDDRYHREIKSVIENFDVGNSKNIKSLLKRQKEKLDYLMERSVDITVVNNNNENILHRIIGDLKPQRFPIIYENISFDDEFHAKLIDQLLALGCGIDINEKNSHDETPLLYAISFISFDIVKVLLDHNAYVGNLKLNYQDKNFFNYPKIYPNLKSMRNLFSIIELLADKGFKLTLQDNLTVLQFLIHDIEDCECWDTSNHHVLQFNMINAMCYGDPKHITHIIDSVKASCEGTEFEEMFRMVISHNLFHFFKLCKIAKMYYPKYHYHLVKKNNCCSLEALIEEAKTEIIYMKFIILEKDITLYDLLIIDLQKIYEYVKSSKVDKFVQRVIHYRHILEGRITRSVSITYFLQSSHDYLRELTIPLLPEACCENIMKNLDCHELLNMCLAVVVDSANKIIDVGRNVDKTFANLCL